MPVRHLPEPDPTPDQIPARRLARAPVIDGRIVGTTDVVRTEAIRDDLGRLLRGHVQGDGSVVLDEPVFRRVFWTGWVR
jgi:hypothetical protein